MHFALCYYLTGFKLDSQKIGAKLTLLVGTFLAIFVYLLYCGAILSYFLVDFNVIQSFSDIFKHPFSVCASPGLESILLPKNNNKRTASVSDMEYRKSLKRVLGGKHVHLGTHDDIGFTYTEMGIPHHEVCRNISYVKIPGNVRVGFYARKSFPHRNLFNIK